MTGRYPGLGLEWLQNIPGPQPLEDLSSGPAPTYSPRWEVRYRKETDARITRSIRRGLIYCKWCVKLHMPDRCQGDPLR